MYMPLVDRRVCAQAVEIFFAVHIVYPHPLCPFDLHVQRMIIVRTVLFLEGDEILGIHKLLVFLCRCEGEARSNLSTNMRLLRSLRSLATTLVKLHQTNAPGWPSARAGDYAPAGRSLSADHPRRHRSTRDCDVRGDNASRWHPCPLRAPVLHSPDTAGRPARVWRSPPPGPCWSRYRYRSHAHPSRPHVGRAENSSARRFPRRYPWQC